MRQIKHKFRAQPTECDGIKFPSKLEKRYYEKLKLRKESGEVIFFLRQQPFHLPANVKYVVDFVEFLENGIVEFIDIKGMMTPMCKMKIKMVEDLYPVKIKIVTRV